MQKCTRSIPKFPGQGRLVPGIFSNWLRPLFISSNRLCPLFPCRGIWSFYLVSPVSLRCYNKNTRAGTRRSHLQLARLAQGYAFIPVLHWRTSFGIKKLTGKETLDSFPWVTTHTNPFSPLLKRSGKHCSSSRWNRFHMVPMLVQREDIKKGKT